MLNNLLAEIIPPYDAGIYEVQSNLGNRPITIMMQDCNYYVAPGNSFRITIRSKTVLQQDLTKYAIINRFGTYQFHDELNEEHVFGAVFYAKEK